MITDIRPDLDTSLREGKTPKEYAHESGISLSWCYRRAWELGWRTMYLSESERALIQKRRKEQKR